MGFGLGIALFLILVFFSFSITRMRWTTLKLLTCPWVKNAMDPLKVLGQGLDFLEDPSKINNDNHKTWCNLHVTPALEGIIVEVRSLEEVTYWGQERVPGV